MTDKANAERGAGGGDETPSSGGVLHCWLCAKPLHPGQERSVFGFGVFLVHRTCYEREMGGKGKPPPVK